MASKQVALGTFFKIDDDTLGFDNQTLVQEITPPPRMRAQIDADELQDTLSVPELGIEEKSEVQYMQIWHPGDTEHEKLDTLFGSMAAFDVQIVTPHATPVTDEFSAKCVGLEPEALGVDGLYRRRVTLVRTTAITRT